MIFCQLILKGKVQGVYLRVKVRDKAVELGLKGYVENLADGNVKLEIKGDEDSIEKLINFIKNIFEINNIDRKDSEISSKQYKDFIIKS